MFVLPKDIVIEILVTLPVIVILRCCNVSREWRELIRSSEFVTYYTKKSKKQFLLLERSYQRNPRVEWLRIHDHLNVPVAPLLRSPFQALESYFQVIGTCNGLVCLADNCDTCYGSVIVWNPLVGKSLFLPLECDCRDIHVYGFGYDPISNDYKVVSVSTSKATVNICRLRSEIWEDISDRAPYQLEIWLNSQITLNGYVHWVGWIGEEKTNKIVSFDLDDEVFGSIDLPEPLASWSNFMEVESYKGLLSVHVFENTTYSIWAMSVYGRADTWNHQISIEFDHQSKWPCGSLEDGYLLNIMANGAFGKFNPITLEYVLIRQYNAFADFSLQDLWWSYYTTSSYMESLVLLDKGPEYSDAATAEALNERKGVQVQEIDAE